MEMIGSYLVGMSLVLAVMLGWVSVQKVARRFASRHPEYGPIQECMGCGLACVCDSHAQKREKQEEEYNRSE